MAKIIPSKLSRSETNKMLDLLYIKIAKLKNKKKKLLTFSQMF